MVNIKEWRQGLGITQKALADAAGLDLPLGSEIGSR